MIIMINEYSQVSNWKLYSNCRTLPIRSHLIILKVFPWLLLKSFRFKELYLRSNQKLIFPKDLSLMKRSFTQFTSFIVWIEIIFFGYCRAIRKKSRSSIRLKLELDNTVLISEKKTKILQYVFLHSLQISSLAYLGFVMGMVRLFC